MRFWTCYDAYHEQPIAPWMIAALAVGGGVIVALVVSIIIYAACSSSHKPKAN